MSEVLNTAANEGRRNSIQDIPPSILPAAGMNHGERTDAAFTKSAEQE